MRLFAGSLSPEEAELVQRVDEVASRAFPEVDLTGGIAPRDVPAAFAQAGLAHVRCLPLGHYFCLSDADTSPDDYRRHIDLLRVVEEELLARLLANPVAKGQLPECDWLRFAMLIEGRHAELAAKQGSNDEWSWYGNSSLLVIGEA